MAIPKSKMLYIYDIDINLIDTIESITKASSALGIPKSTIIDVVDKRDVNKEKRTMRSKRVYSSVLDKYIIIKSYKLITNRKIIGL